MFPTGLKNLFGILAQCIIHRKNLVGGHVVLIQFCSGVRYLVFTQYPDTNDNVFTVHDLFVNV